MACLTPVTIRIDTPTGPLNSACFDSGRNKIFAVRDNWIYQLNGTTGAKEAEFRFAQPGIQSDVFIDYDSSTDKLWTTLWRATPTFAENRNTVRYIVRIDPDDITSATTYPNSAAMDVGAYLSTWASGHRKMITRGGFGWFLHSFGNDAEETDVARINLSVPSVTHTTTYHSGDDSWSCMHHDGTNLFLADNGDEQISMFDPADLSGIATTIGEVAGRYPHGLTRDPGNGFLYIATTTQFIVKAEVGGGATASSIDLGQVNANPYNIRYNANDQLIYVPLYNDDTVAVIDPSDDSFEIKTGFTNPFDMVFTDSKAFALQHSAIGIREIT